MPFCGGQRNSSAVYLLKASFLSDKQGCQRWWQIDAGSFMSLAERLKALLRGDPASYQRARQLYSGGTAESENGSGRGEDDPEALMACLRGSSQSKSISTSASGFMQGMMRPRDVFSLVFEDTGRSILMSAARWGRRRCCVMILSECPEAVHLVNKEGFTALHYACFGGWGEVARCLLRHGADIDATNKYGEDCLRAALSGGHVQLAQDLGHELLTGALTATLSLPSSVVTTPPVSALCHSYAVSAPPSRQSAAALSSAYSCMAGFFAASIFGASVLTNASVVKSSPPGLSSLSIIPQSRADITGTQGYLESISVCSSEGSCGIDSCTCEGAVFFQAMQPKSSCPSVSASLEVVSVSCPEGKVKIDRSILGMKFDLCTLLRDSPTQAISIGRSRSNDIAIPDLSLSKRHAAICLHRGMGIVLKDLGSTHGCFVNDRRVTASGRSGGCSIPELCILRNGDRIRLGRIECLLTLHVDSVVAADRHRDSSAAVISKGFLVNASLGSRLSQLDQMDRSLRATYTNDAARKARKRYYHDMATSREVAVSQRISEAMQSVPPQAAPVAPFGMTCDVGSGLLRKLGWQEGRGLGREGREGQSSYCPERIFAPRVGLGVAGALLGVVGEASAQLQMLPLGESPSSALQEHARRVTAQRYSELLRKEGAR